MSINPFDDENGIFRVLVNDEEQHSIWPDGVEIPEGWRVVFGEDSRANCLSFIEGSWTDMRPASMR